MIFRQAVAAAAIAALVVTAFLAMIYDPVRIDAPTTEGE